MKEKLATKREEIEKVLTDLRIKQLELIKIAFEGCDDIKSVELNYDEESNDEGGSYRIYSIQSINDIGLENELSQYFIEEWNEDDEEEFDEIKTFCIENNIKSSNIKEMGDVLLSFDDNFIDSLKSTIKLADIENEIKKISK